MIPVPPKPRACSRASIATQGYIEALFFTDEERLCEESEGAHMVPSVAINLETMESRFVGGDSVSFADLSEAALEACRAACISFQKVNEALLAQASELVPGGDGFKYGHDVLDDRRLGQLFWYARNGHGVAFTDDGGAPCLQALQEAARAVGQVDSYIGDDGLIYLM